MNNKKQIFCFILLLYLCCPARQVIAADVSTKSDDLAGALFSTLFPKIPEDNIKFFSGGDNWIHFDVTVAAGFIDIQLHVADSVGNATEALRRRIMMMPIWPNVGDDKICPNVAADKRWIFTDGYVAWKNGHCMFRRGLIVVDGCPQGGVDFTGAMEFFKKFDAVLAKVDPVLLGKQIAAYKASRMPKPGPPPLSDEEKQREIALIIKQLGTEVIPEKIPKLIDRLKELNDASAVPVIIPYMEQKYDVVTRQQAIKALGELRDRRAIAPLVEFLRQPITGKNLADGGPEESLRRNAVFALKRIGDPAAIPFLKNIEANNGEYALVREFAKIAIEELERKRDE